MPLVASAETTYRRPHSGSQAEAPARSTRWRILSASALGGWLWPMALLTGCGPTWVYDYQSAENLAKQRNLPILAFYRDHLDPASSRMYAALTSPPASPLLQHYINLNLIEDHYPNRVWVSQYNVNRVPSLIVVHSDRTYHSRMGEMNGPEIAEFLRGAQPPGESPKEVPQVPRNVDFQWINSYEQAIEKGSTTNRKVFIFYKWWLSAECTEMLRVLDRPEVARHFANTVNCILDWDYVPNRAHVAQYGVDRFPAMMVVMPDGTFHSKIGPQSAEQIVSFATSARGPGRQALGQVPTKSAGDGDAWNASFDDAFRECHRRNLPLLVFYHSTFSADSNQAATVLEKPMAQEQIKSMIRCRLDWRYARNRDLMLALGITRVPAFVIIRPDDTYHSRVGYLETNQLLDFLDLALRRGQTLPEKITQLAR